ncbi:MAG: hypothetical protein KatS3mg071_1920 [Meiothermus sp.]|nr:MAG: hypothetical protein KatS3mg071_1920 [Meiothermus sp.]
MKNWKAKAQQAFERYLEDLEQSLAPGVGLAGIEAAMLRYNPELLRAVMQGLAEETQALSPLEIPPGWRKVGVRWVEVQSPWGRIQTGVQRLRDETGREHSRRLDASLDSSGYTPGALERLMELAGRLPYEEAAELARLHAAYSERWAEAVHTHLAQQAWTALAEGGGRLMVLEVDGVRVGGQPQPQTHTCEGIEIKCALVYPAHHPRARSRLAGVMTPEELLPRVAGLLRAAGVRAGGCADRGIGRGGLVMQQLGWSEVERRQERALWLRTYRPPPTAPERMHYPAYRARGWPIGSGQVEGMNKHVIGARMKRSGMQWSRPGASRTAAHRAQLCSSRPLVAFDTPRWEAFPVRKL